jgi:hypothetical protein
MKGQITKHEWIDTARHWIKRCAHCSGEKSEVVESRPIEYVYRKHNGPWQEEEPKCITRKITEDEG